MKRGDYIKKSRIKFVENFKKFDIIHIEILVIEYNYLNLKYILFFINIF